jgi:hypothetical protein
LCPLDRAAASLVTEVGPAWPSCASSRDRGLAKRQLNRAPERVQHHAQQATEEPRVPEARVSVVHFSVGP